MEYKDYYKLLGVERGSSQDEIKKSYRRLARKFHPDVSKEANAEERFKQVNEAYEVLGDPEKRKAYDQLGQNWKAGQDFRPPPGWESWFGGSAQGDPRSQDGFKVHFGGGDFSDFFETLFGGGPRRTRGHRTHRPGSGVGHATGRGEDRSASLPLSLEQAFQGGPITVHVGDRSLQVKIPPGVTDGQRIRLAGQGGAGFDGVPAGDLYLDVSIRPHPYFRLEGRDIHLDLPITPWEAALGDTIAVPTLKGAVDMRIPAGSRSGTKLRLRGRGLPGDPPGDQYVILQIVVPPAESEKAREFYARMREAMPFDPRSHLRR